MKRTCPPEKNRWQVVSIVSLKWYLFNSIHMYLMLMSACFFHDLPSGKLTVSELENGLVDSSLIYPLKMVMSMYPLVMSK